MSSVTPPPPGVFVPVPTFFHPAAASTSAELQARLDMPSQVKHSIFLAERGITGLVLLGSTGEAVHLSRAERRDLLAGVRKGLGEAGFSEYPIMAGVMFVVLLVQRPSASRRDNDATSSWRGADEVRPLSAEVRANPWISTIRWTLVAVVAMALVLLPVVLPVDYVLKASALIGTLPALSEPPNEKVSSSGPISNVTRPRKSGPSTWMRAPTLIENVISPKKPRSRVTPAAMRA